MLKYAAPILVAGIAFVINESADKILLKYLLPKSVSMRELGIYSACYKLTIFMTLFVPRCNQEVQVHPMQKAFQSKY